MKLLIVQPSSTSYYYSLGPVILLSTMFSTSLICSTEHNFKYYLKNTTTSFIELHKKKGTAVNSTNILRSSCHVSDNVVRLKKKIICQQIFMKIPVYNSTKMLPVVAALMHADKQTGRHDEANKRTSPFMRKRLKTPKCVDFNYRTMIR